MQRVGSKGAMGEFAKALCAHLTPQLITVRHLAELLKLAQAEESPPDEAFLEATLRLLADSALAAPRIIASLEPQVLPETSQLKVPTEAAICTCCAVVSAGCLSYCRRWISV